VSERCGRAQLFGHDRQTGGSSSHPSLAFPLPPPYHKRFDAYRKDEESESSNQSNPTMDSYCIPKPPTYCSLKPPSRQQALRKKSAKAAGVEITRSRHGTASANC
jgi:hypothetical protein